MRVRKGLGAALAALLAAVLCCFVTTPAYAVGVDLTATGSITLTMQDDGDVVPGGSVELYRVASLDADGTFELEEEFAGSGVDLTGLSIEDFSDDKLAEDLLVYARRNNVDAYASAEVGEGGVVTFQGVEVGLYLVAQGDAAPGYQSFSPFLVSMPWLDEGGYDFTIEAEPKLEPTPPGPGPDEPDDPDEPDTPDEPDEPDEPDTPDEPDEPDTPDEPDEPDTPDTPDKPEDPTPEGPKHETPTPGTPAEHETKVPNTGTPDVMVPVIAVGGVGLVLVGASLYLGKRGEDRG